MNGAKTLVLDPSLAGPLGLVTEVALLKVSTKCFLGVMEGLDRISVASWSGQDVLARTRSSIRFVDQHRVPMSTTHQVHQDYGW